MYETIFYTVLAIGVFIFVLIFFLIPLDNTKYTPAYTYDGDHTIDNNDKGDTASKDSVESEPVKENDINNTGR